MAVIYLRHPDHGAKIAISEMEAKNDMQNGWEEFDPNSANAPAKEPVASADPEPVLAEPVKQQPRRRSRRAMETPQ